MQKNIHEILYLSLRNIIKPVVRFALNRSIKIQEFIELTKEAFIEVAEEELQKKEATVSNSRLAVITGMHRRDVTRLTSNQKGADEEENLLRRVIGQWQNDKRFSANAKAKTLDIEGEESDFKTLVRSVSKDLNPYTILFELERLGAVERVKDGVKLLTKVYAPVGDIRRSMGLLANDVSDLVTAVDENIFSKQEFPNLHITTAYDNIAEKDLAEIRRWMLAKGDALHAELREYLSKFDLDVNPKMQNKNLGGCRVSFSTFSTAQSKANLNDNEDD
ncbi:hypothetical protein JNK13_00575 [bacterium]|nr:hypothetical protein [bacterium]